GALTTPRPVNIFCLPTRALLRPWTTLTNEGLGMMESELAAFVAADIAACERSIATTKAFLDRAGGGECEMTRGALADLEEHRRTLVKLRIERQIVMQTPCRR